MKLLRARPLPAGGTIGIIAPSSRAKGPALRAGAARLRAAGYRVKLLCAPGLRDGYLAGPDAVRARLFNRAFTDPSVDAVFCERGGYGALRILDDLDFRAVARHPKPFVGFSDITILQWALWKRCRLVTFYGPMVAFPGPAYNDRHLWRAVTATAPLGRVPVPPVFKPRFPRPGRATGRILGGTVSLISKLVGTPWMPELSGVILFLEDVEERPYKIDGFLAHLKHAGVLDRVAGVILANFKKCWAPPARSLTLDRIIRDYFGRAPYPVAVGMPFGHLDPMFTLPQGVRATLDSRRGLVLEEAALQGGTHGRRAG